MAEKYVYKNKRCEERRLVKVKINKKVALDPPALRGEDLE